MLAGVISADFSILGQNIEGKAISYLEYLVSEVPSMLQACVEAYTEAEVDVIITQQIFVCVSSPDDCSKHLRLP